MKVPKGSSTAAEEVRPRNTIGDVPLNWYQEEEHIGYDITGKKIKKQPKMDMLDSFLADKSKNRLKIHDDYNDEDLEVGKEEQRLIRRVLKGKTPHDPYKKTKVTQGKQAVKDDSDGSDSSRKASKRKLSMGEISTAAKCIIKDKDATPTPSYVFKRLESVLGVSLIHEREEVISIIEEVMSNITSDDEDVDGDKASESDSYDEEDEILPKADDKEDAGDEVNKGIVKTGPGATSESDSYNDEEEAKMGKIDADMMARVEKTPQKADADREEANNEEADEGQNAGD